MAFIQKYIRQELRKLQADIDTAKETARLLELERKLKQNHLDVMPVLTQEEIMPIVEKEVMPIIEDFKPRLCECKSGISRMVDDREVCIKCNRYKR